MRPRSRSRAAAASARAASMAARGRQQRLAVGQRPAQVLRVGQLEPRRAQRLGQRHQLGHARDVAAVQDHVQRQRQPQRAHRCGGRPSLRRRPHARRSRPRPAGRRPAPRAASCRAPPPPAAPGGRASAGMPLVIRLTYSSRLRAAATSVFEVAPHQRFAAGQVDLQDAQRRRLGEHPLPVGGAELGRPPHRTDPAGSSSTRTRADSGRSARRSACTAAGASVVMAPARPAARDPRARAGTRGPRVSI